MRCDSVQVGDCKYGHINCYGGALDGHGLVVKLVPESNVKAVRRLEREGMLFRALPAVGRTLPRRLHWAVDKQVCCSRPVRMRLRVHCPSPALACHRDAAARRQRVALQAVSCTALHDNDHGSQLPCSQLVSAVALPSCLCVARSHQWHAGCSGLQKRLLVLVMERVPGRDRRVQKPAEFRRLKERAVAASDRLWEAGFVHLWI
jgi:hypothetical protein